MKKLKFRETQFSIQLLNESQHSKLQAAYKALPSLAIIFLTLHSMTSLFLHSQCSGHTELSVISRRGHALSYLGAFAHVILQSPSPPITTSVGLVYQSIHPSRICLSLCENFPNEVKCSLCNIPLELCKCFH